MSLRAGPSLKDLYAALRENFPCDPNMKMVEGVSEFASQLGVEEDQLKGKTMMEKLQVLCDAAGISVAQQADTPQAPAEPAAEPPIAGGGVGGGLSPRPGNYGGCGNMLDMDTGLSKEEMAKIARMEQGRRDEESAHQLARQEQYEASNVAACAPPKATGGPKGWGDVKRALADLVPKPAPAAATGAGSGAADVRRTHVARLADDSLLEQLMEAFKIAEIRFGNFDKDRAGALSFAEVKRDIALAGFYDQQKLLEIWTRCDIDKSDMIDFKEFLYMLFMWQYAHEIGTTATMKGQLASAHIKATRIDLYSAFFKFKINREIVFGAFSKMENYYSQYDADQNHKLSLLELKNFMSNHLPVLFKSQRTQQLIEVFYPSSMPRREIYFPEFLGLIYLCCVEYDPNRLKGEYKSQCMPAAGGPRLSLGNLRNAYVVLERDFNTYDADGNGRLELSELAKLINIVDKKQNVDIFSKLQRLMYIADVDRSGDLDFFQFCLFAFHSCGDGSYTKLINKTTDGGG
jgi:Ca2+-binding EF-hand superfamily protein